MIPLEVETEAQPMSTVSGFPVADRRKSWERFKIFNKEFSTLEKPFPATSPDQINLIISVEDTGAGIPFEAQSRVFTPFMQVGPSISRIHGGTGIGLSISKCLVNLMKGEIGFASKPQVGSTFTFTAVLSRAKTNSTEYKSFEFRGLTALVVDHRPARAKVTKYHLERLGMHVDFSTNFSLVLPKITSGNLGLKIVLVDKETWLKESSQWPIFMNKLRIGGQLDIPKLFILANSSSPIKSSSLSSNGFNYTIIMKPLRACMLQVSLRRALGGGDSENNRSGGLSSNSLHGLLHGRKILVVDDNIVNIRVAAGALKKYGAEVTCADSGKKAIALLTPPHDFDACFMDIQMPEMDG